MNGTQRVMTLVAIATLVACARESDIQLDEPRAVSVATGVGTAPMYAVSGTGQEAVAWVSASDGGTDGRVYIAVNGAMPTELRDSLGSIEAHGESPPKLAWGPDGALNTIYVVAKVVPGRRFPAAALRFARSMDDGRTWNPPVTVTDDSEFGSHNFHALHAGADGSLYVSWLDGRHGQSAAYVTRSTDGGQTWSPNVRVSLSEACPCCRTGIVSAADGTLYLAWRTVMPGNVRDIVVARSSDRGATWSDPVRVHADDWVFEGCPHAGPSLQVDSTGAVHVAWWTGKSGSAGVFHARSTDGARTFGAPVPLSVADFSRPAHVQLALGPAGVVAAVWDDGTQDIPQVRLRVSRDGGRTFGAPIDVSERGQVATYPVAAITGGVLTVAWSQKTPDAAAHEERARPDMTDPGAVMGLHAVGTAQVLVRRGALR